MRGGVSVSGCAAIERSPVEHLAAIEPEWLALWRRCPPATPFQSPAWLIPWWRHLGAGDLRLAAFRTAGKLVGLAPFHLLDAATGSARKLQLLGAGISDYLDVLVEPDYAAEVASVLEAGLDRERDGWEICEFDGLREGSILLRISAPAGCADIRQPQAPCPVLTLPERVEDLKWAVPKRMFERWQYHQRRAARQGRVEFAGADAGTCGRLLDQLFRLHAARWNARGQAGVLVSAALERFHREAAGRLLELGVLRLWALWLDGRVAACLYGMQHARRFHYYLGGFDPACASLNPGTLIIGHAITQAVREGAREFDFLRGAEPYKYRWGAKDTHLLRRTIAIREDVGTLNIQFNNR